MTPIVDRVRKLIALSASPNENEARSAAFMACRLIREHGLRVTDLAPRAGVSTARSPRRRNTRGPYVRDARAARCRECDESIVAGDAFLDADGKPVHGDCIPSGERP